jgi:hypothetical protein
VIDRLEVVWPDREQQVLTNIASDQTLILSHSEASATATAPKIKPDKTIFSENPDVLKGNSRHVENRYNDFDHEGLLLRMLSTEGPRIVKGDVNNDDKVDFILLGAKDDPDKLFIQSGDYFQLKSVNAFIADKTFESTCGALLDFDGDGDQDLLVGSGGNEYQMGGQNFIVRYYQNDGQGGFTAMPNLAPPIVGNFSCIEAGDLDGDGDLDVFFGGRAIPGNYGLTPRSFLFKNNQGSWEDITLNSMAGIGMVTDATWSDVDANGSIDLVVVGDWMDINIFKNDRGTLHSSVIVPNSKGWWTRVETADLDNDGDYDFVLGNWGKNVKLQASPERPLTMYVNDFDQNGKSEFIINWFPSLDNTSYPFATKMDLTTQLPILRKQSLKYEDYAHQTYTSLFDAEVRLQSLTYEANFLESAILWNDSIRMTLEALPIEAQFAPMFGIAINDFNEDALPDIWMGGNFYGLKPQVGRHDASRGILLENKGDRTFTAISPMQSGISVKGEVREAEFIDLAGRQVLLIARNNDNALIFEKSSQENK